MVRKSVLGVLFLFLFVSLCYAEDATVEFEGRYWITDLTGKVKVTEHGVGSVVDLKDDLGMSNKNFPEGRFTWYINDSNRIRLAYTELDYSGDTVLQRNIQFKGQTYTVGAPVSSDIDLEYLRLGWIWQFLNADNGMFRLGTLLEIKGFSAKTNVQAPTLGISESEKIMAPLPTVGLALDINPHKMIDIFAEISGVTAGNYGSLIDGEAGVKFKPTKNVSLVAGYRIFSIDAKDNSDYFRMDVKGPFFGATVRF